MFDYDFDINGCPKNRSVNYNEKSFLANNGSPCRGWDVENDISTTNVNKTFGWGQSSLAYRYNSNNCLQLRPVQWVGAGDISELVAGSRSICVQRQNKGAVSEIEYSTCFFADKRGHSGRMVTLSPPTSEAGVQSPSWP